MAYAVLGERDKAEQCYRKAVDEEESAKAARSITIPPRCPSS